MFIYNSLVRAIVAVIIIATCIFGLFANNNNPGNNIPNNPSTPGNISGSRPENASVSVFLTDFETIEGFNAWTLNPFGKDNSAPIGRFEVGVPQKGKYQPGATPDGKKALVTGLAFGGNASAGDLDEGQTSAASPEILLPEITGNARLEFSCKYLFSHGANVEAADFLRVKILCEKTETTVFELIGDGKECAAGWSDFSVVLNQFAGKSIRFLVEAADLGEASLLEAGIDAVKVRMVKPALWLETFASNAWDDNANAPGGCAFHSIVVEANWSDLLPGDKLEIRVPGGFPEVQVFEPKSATDMNRFIVKVPTEFGIADIKAQILTQKGLEQSLAIELPKKGGILSPCLDGDFGGKIWLDEDLNGIMAATETRGIEAVPMWAHWLNPATEERGTAGTATDYLGQYSFHFGKGANDLPQVKGLQIRLAAESQELSTRRGERSNFTDLRFLNAQPTCLEHFGIAKMEKGSKKSGEIGNLIWEDTNGDGLQNAGEPGLEGVQISLYDELGNYIAVATTDKMGNYFFNETNVKEQVGEVTKTDFAGPVPGKNYMMVVGKTNDAFNAVSGQLTLGQKKWTLTEHVSRAGFANAPDNSDAQLFKGFISIKSLLNGFPGCTLVAPAAGGEYRFDFGFKPVVAR